MDTPVNTGTLQLFTVNDWRGLGLWGGGVRVMQGRGFNCDGGNV